METITIKPDGQVFLTLPDSNYKKFRVIGKINFSEKTFHTKKSQKHVLRLYDGLGFCHKLINEINSFDFVCVNYENRKIWTSRKIILSKNLVHKFSKGKLEKQIFLPLEYFKNSKELAEIELKALERNNQKYNKPGNDQMNLFKDVG